MLNRGQSNPDLFPDAEKLIGDRDGDLDALRGRQWDIAFDVAGYLPRLVRDSARLLSENVGHYVFVSTLSVYARFDVSGQDERAPLGTMPDPAVEEITGETYGPLKVLCEQAAREAFPGRTLIIRPGYIVGPYDPTDRFAYWLRRTADGGELLAPGEPASPLQFVDGRDLTAFTMRLAETKVSDTFNLTGPAESFTWGELFDQCQSVAGVETKVTWVADSFLEEHAFTGGELPMWPGSADRGVMEFDVGKAIAAGLAFRPVSETIRDTLVWDAENGPRKNGLTPEREAELLAAWKAVNKE